jgi:hypothetical protein
LNAKIAQKSDSGSSEKSKEKEEEKKDDKKEEWRTASAKKPKKVQHARSDSRKKENKNHALFKVDRFGGSTKGPKTPLVYMPKGKPMY